MHFTTTLTETLGNSVNIPAHAGSLPEKTKLQKVDGNHKANPEKYNHCANT